MALSSKKYPEKRAIVIMLYGGEVTLLPSFQACIPLLLTDKIASAASVQDVSEDIAIREIEAMSIVLLHFLLHREGQICVSLEFCSQCMVSQTVPLPKTFTVHHRNTVLRLIMAASFLFEDIAQIFDLFLVDFPTSLKSWSPVSWGIGGVMLRL